jgi:flavin reductase (DIM6/NTAB) family NADH-FMN oxidoreductase RutF
MGKIKIKNSPLVYPLPAILAGAMVNGKPNYETLGDCTILSVSPAVICISSQKRHYTNVGIHAHNHFSVNIPSADMVVPTDYCGIVSGRDTDKSMVFDTFYGEHPMIPMISECPVNLACEVIKKFAVYSMEVFVGEIVGTYVSEDCCTDGRPDTGKINPLIYCLDNQYWSIGSVVGKGFSDGKKYKSEGVQQPAAMDGDDASES